MSLPGNGIFVVQGEMNILVTAMRRSTRWGSHSFLNEEYDVLMRTFQDLKTILNQVDDLRLLDPATYLSPFLEVIRSKETTGPVTSLALSAINKFLSYGLIDPTHPSVPAMVEDIAEAVTHARFVGTDHSSDGVVLMKILQLLRRNAEQCLRDMTQLIFMRLPQFPPEDAGALASLHSGGLSLKKRERASKRRSLTTVNTEEPAEPDGVAASPPPATPPPDDLAESKAREVEEYINHRGIRFRQESPPDLQPFLISLSNPLEAQNTSAMVHLGLTLVGTALEVSADTLQACPSLLLLIKDPLCRNLVTLLSTERISIFALDLQVSFLLFEAMRFHLKFQMEAFFKKIIEIISADTSKAIYELKEIHHLALESLIQIFRIPGLCTELYLNYDCDVYCMNVFEELTKLLSKNVVSSTAYEIHQLSLEALLTILEAIELGVNASKEKSETDIVAVEEKEETYGRSGHVTLELVARQARHKPTANMPTEAELDNVKNMKKWVTQGTELFNQKPERGIEFLQEHGVLKTPLDPHQVALFLRENPDLDKKMIDHQLTNCWFVPGEYICKRSSRGEEDDGPSVLGAFADSFQYAGLRIEQALRLYLETFRLPGEAPLIFLCTNGEPFANTDAAFRLAYAVIMLNMDQHNHTAKKLNVPMTAEDFVKNLRGCNGSGDFEPGMLEEIFHSIKSTRRDAGGAVPRAAAAPPPPFEIIRTGLPARAAFERAAAPTAEEVERGDTRNNPALTALQGLERTAALTARLPADALTLDSLALTLCKFTGLLAPQHAAYIAIDPHRSRRLPVSYWMGDLGQGTSRERRWFTELIRAMIKVGTPPDSDSLQLNPQLEDITIFFLELLGQTLIQNSFLAFCSFTEVDGRPERKSIDLPLLYLAIEPATVEYVKASVPKCSDTLSLHVKNDAASPSLDNCEFGDVRLRPHRAAALARCCEALALVVRDVAHVTPHNCRAAVRAVRIFARATLHAGNKSSKSSEGRKSRPSSARRRANDDSSDEETDTLDQYHMVSIQTNILLSKKKHLFNLQAVARYFVYGQKYIEGIDSTSRDCLKVKEITIKRK
ncbi:Uncharacterized protein OBRU01_06368 [Operophtera brumata]|uniref:SEC7 domain-containing protein n=1 Tax=Operophtera brumata TaxID=104452 RepID=A0A0L7LKQ8_OPEBR|nr:Uncharacterized protein OBRU01_06368 [Operophtera brumata]